MSAYNDLMVFQRQTEALAQVAGRLGWDQETMMSPGSADQRSEEMAAMEGVLHARRTDPRIGEWLTMAAGTTAEETANLRLIKRSFERTMKVPADLAAEIARVTSKSQGTWAKARAANDVASFLPTFQQVIDLKREEGQALAAGSDIYDAMLEDYEPGATGAQLAAMFDAMRPGLVDLRAAVLAAKAPPTLDHAFDEDAQLVLTKKLAVAFGYDLNIGRIDKAVHPFSSGSGQDVRITTRTSARDPFNSIYSTIHEVGHATYEQNVDADYLLTPLGSGASMGVHESQSRIYENQLGRSRAFTSWLYGQMRDTFGDFGISDAEAFYKVVNRVNNGYIRTEADELQYNLHVMLRFDLERALMSGDLALTDLEAAWNDRFLSDFGYAVETPSHGVLQDVHWPVGLFGYFPTYSLGNVYAGCLNEALRREVTDLDADLARGETTRATAWLRDNLQRHGSLFEPRETITKASGMEPSEAPLMGYLQEKFSDIYGL